MRISKRWGSVLVAFLLTLIFCFYALQPRTTRSHFDFLNSSLLRESLDHPDNTFQDETTGGWLTRWLPTSWSPMSLLGNSRRPAPSRCPVYTYIDTTVHRRGSDEFAILRIWMKAFWALGFQPIVLTGKDARRHSQYNAFRSQRLGQAIGEDLSKWFAMALRGGLFVDYRVNLPLHGLTLDHANANSGQYGVPRFINV
jgi:hypothetical protein